MMILRILHNGRPGSSYNIGSGVELTNLSLAEMICKQMIEKGCLDKRSHMTDFFTFIPDRLGHDFRYFLNSCKLIEELTWNPKTVIDHGLELTIDWYLHQEIN